MRNRVKPSNCQYLKELQYSLICQENSERAHRSEECVLFTGLERYTIKPDHNSQITTARSLSKIIKSTQNWANWPEGDLTNVILQVKFWWFFIVFTQIALPKSRMDMVSLHVGPQLVSDIFCIFTQITNKILWQMVWQGGRTSWLTEWRGF